MNEDASSIPYSAAALRSMIEGFPGIVVVLDRERRVVALNAAARAMASTSTSTSASASASAIGARLDDLSAMAAWPDAALRHALDACTTALAGGVSRYTAWSRDGAAALDITVTPLRDDDGAIPHIMFCAVDVHGKRLAEQRYQTIIEQAADSIFVMDTEGRYIEVNDAACRLLGWSRAELLTQSAAQSVPPGEPPPRVAQLHAGAVITASRDLVTRSGTRVHVEVRSQRLDDGSVLGVVRDLTERIRDRAALGAAEAHARTIVDSAPCAIYELDEHDRVMSMNDEGRRMFALPLSTTLRGTAVVALFADVETARTRLASARTSGRTEIELQSTSGRRVRCTFVPVHASEDGAGRVLGISSDVTERHALEQSQRESLQEKETLLRELHHRVKNNLQVISSLVHFHAKRATGEENVAAFTDLRQRLHAMGLVHEQLFLSQKLSRVDMREYVSSLVAALVGAAATRGRVSTHVAVDDVSLPLEQALPAGMILCELLTNALKHAFPEPRDGRVDIRVLQDGGAVAMSVADDGIGTMVNPEVRRASGFGMELVRSLAEQLEASIELSHDTGTRVVVRFHTIPHGKAS